MAVATTGDVAAGDGSSRLGLRVAVLCGFIQISDGYDVGTVGMTVPSLVREWHIAPAAFASAFVMSSVGILIGALLAGPIGDRFGRKRVLLISAFIISIFSFATVFVDGLPSLVLVRFFTGIGCGGALPMTVALTSHYAPRQRIPTYIMFMFAGNTVGGFVGGLAASQILPAFGWQGVYLVGGMMPLAVIPFAWALIPGSAPAAVAAVAHPPLSVILGGLFRDGMATRTVLIWAAFLINLLNLYLLLYWMPTVLSLSGFTPADAALGASMISAGGIVCIFAYGPLADRFTPQRVLLFVMPCGAIFVFSASYFVMPWAVELGVIFCIGAAVVGAQHLLNATATMLYPQSIRGTGVGWALGVGRLGGIAGPALGGLLLGSGMPPKEIFRSVCFTVLLATAIIFVLSRIIRANALEPRRLSQVGEVLS